MTVAEQGVGLLLVQVCRAHRNLVAGALEALDVHVGQEHVVYRLAIEQGLSQSQLAEALCVDASTLTKMLHRLVRDGIVERRPDATDARVQRVYLTAYGARLVQPVIDIWRNAEARLQANMTDAERALLRRLLLQMHTEPDGEGLMSSTQLVGQPMTSDVPLSDWPRLSLWLGAMLFGLLDMLNLAIGVYHTTLFATLGPSAMFLTAYRIPVTAADMTDPARSLGASAIEVYSVLLAGYGLLSLWATVQMLRGRSSGFWLNAAIHAAV